MDPYLAEIRMFAGNFAPRNWALCEGQILAISQNQSLYSLLGNMYGGDGRNTFALPDLRGRAVISPGVGPGLSNFQIGQKAGAVQVILDQNTLPSHSHSLNCSGSSGSGSNPTNNFPALAQVQVERGGTNHDVMAYGASANSAMGGSAVGNTGGNIPVNIQNPNLGLNYIICTNGIYPSRS